MKVLKAFANFILCISLFTLILALSLTFILKKVFQEEIVVGIAKTEVIEKFVDSEDSQLTSEQKAIVKDVLNKKETTEVIDIAIDNYLSYTVNENYNLSTKDYDLIIKYVEKHIDIVDKFVDAKVDIDYVKDKLTYERANELAKEAFKHINDEGGITLSEENITAINTYAYAVSNEVRYYIISGIALVILLLMVVNWSISKWMVEAGIALILSGTLIDSLYVLSEFAKDLLANDSDIGKYIISVDIKYALIIGTAEFLFGIALIIINSKINKLESKENI